MHHPPGLSLPCAGGRAGPAPPSGGDPAAAANGDNVDRRFLVLLGAALAGHVACWGLLVLAGRALLGP